MRKRRVRFTLFTIMTLALATPRSDDILFRIALHNRSSDDCEKPRFFIQSEKRGLNHSTYCFIALT